MTLPLLYTIRRNTSKSTQKAFWKNIDKYGVV